jgi:hypothetical protein
VNGGGGKERKVIANQTSFLRKVLEDPTGYQLLCANCNWIKRHERHEFGSGNKRKIQTGALAFG